MAERTDLDATSVGAADARVRPLEAIVRHPVMFTGALLIVLVVTVGLVLSGGSSRRAEAQLVFGNVDVNTNAVSGYTTASQQLAATYARFITSTDTINAIAKAVNETPDSVRSRVSASPIPESPLIRVWGDGTNSTEALRIADAASTALINYVNGLNDSSGKATDYLTSYQQASQTLAEAKTELAPAQAAYNAAVASNSPNANALLGAVTAAQSKVDQAQLKVDAYQQLYVSTLGSSGQSNNLRLFSAATPLPADHTKKLELGVLAGLLIGGLFATVLVLIASNGWKLLPQAAQKARAKAVGSGDGPIAGEAVVAAISTNGSAPATTEPTPAAAAGIDPGLVVPISAEVAATASEGTASKTRNGARKSGAAKSAGGAGAKKSSFDAISSDLTAISLSDEEAAAEATEPQPVRPVRSASTPAQPSTETNGAGRGVRPTRSASRASRPRRSSGQEPKSWTESTNGNERPAATIVPPAHH